MNLADLLLGRPLATEDEKAQRIGPAKGIPIFGLDALSSAAYGPEAALTLLIPLGMAGITYILPISISIVVLLGIVYFSYRQTIEAYPQGGGSYTVASENLGVWAGLLAAASLMVDYVLTAAVGISAGVGALVSAVPSLQRHTLIMCLGILTVLTLVNLRGVRETGGIFLIPTYLFIVCLLGMIAIGVVKAIAAGGHPVPVVTPPRLMPATAGVGAWLLMRAFASGCTAMTGVEAVSNGVMAFKDPTYKYARRTLTIIIAILMLMLLGIAYLAPAYGVAATVPGEQGYQSVLSQLLAAITGKGGFLLDRYHFDPGCTISLSKHRVRRLPAAFSCDCRQRISALCPYRTRATPRLRRRRLRACDPNGYSANHFSRSNGPAHSALCSRGIYGVYTVPGRHGCALEEGWRP